MDKPTGRPPLPEHRRRTVRLQVVLTEAEATEVEQARGDLTVSDFIRAAIRGEVRRARRRKPKTATTEKRQQR